MRSPREHLGEVEARGKLSMPARWRESGLPMTARAKGRGMGLAVAVLMAAGYDGRWRGKVAWQPIGC
jgi:hypothetical protein